MDGRAFARNFPATIALGFLTFHACKFVVEQTAPIYESLSFPNPEVASLGALALAVGFAGFSALSRSGVAKLFMGIMVCYELMLVYTGTKVNQNDISSEALRLNPAYVHALEYHELVKKDFALKKASFEDQNSQVYHNNWYKLKHLDPSFEKFLAATQNLIQLESDLKLKEENIDFQLWLKVLFRISALALCMLLAKELVHKGTRAFRFSY